MTGRGKPQVRLKGKYRKSKPLTEIKTLKFLEEKEPYNALRREIGTVRYFS